MRAFPRFAPPFVAMLLATGLTGFNCAEAINLESRWSDLNVITGVDGFGDITVREDYNENNLVPFPSEDGSGVVNAFPDSGCPASESVCWFDTVISMGFGDAPGERTFSFVVTNTSPFTWSDYHFLFYDPTFQNQIGDILVGAFGAGGFLGIGVSHDPDVVEYFAGNLAPGSTTTFRLDVDLLPAQQFGLRQVATTVPEPTSIFLVVAAVLGFGAVRRSAPNIGRSPERGPQTGACKSSLYSAAEPRLR